MNTITRVSSGIVNPLYEKRRVRATPNPPESINLSLQCKDRELIFQITFNNSSCDQDCQAVFTGDWDRGVAAGPAYCLLPTAYCHRVVWGWADRTSLTSPERARRVVRRRVVNLKDIIIFLSFHET
jgi:hypothetical protein